MSGIWNLAITRDHFPILIVKNGVVVGKARWSAAADGITSMRITEGKALEWVEKIAVEHGGGVMEAKHFNPRYFDFDGSYAPRPEDGWEFIDKAFEGTRAVSEFALGYAMVPDSFKDVVGYGAKHSEVGA
jgi:hypothetical protein